MTGPASLIAAAAARILGRMSGGASFEAALARATTIEGVRDLFSTAVRRRGLHAFDAMSARADLLAHPRKACEFYLSDYGVDDPFGYIDKIWTPHDPVLEAMCARSTPFEYVGFLKAAEKTPFTIWQVGVLTLYDVRRAWVFPHNTIGSVRAVTVYQRGVDDAEAFEAARDPLNLISAPLIEKLAVLSGADEPPAATPPGAAPITGREVKCLELAAEGATNRQIGEALEISENTVRFHLKNAFKKLDAHTRAGAVRAARKLGAISL